MNFQLSQTRWARSGFREAWVNFFALSLGQGQAPIAARLLREGVVQGQCLPSSSAPNHGPGLTVHQLPPVTLLSLQLPLLQKALGVGTSALGPSP